MMSRVLIDYARSKQAAKRGGGGIQVTLEDAVAVAEARGIDLLELDEALIRLAELVKRALSQGAGYSAPL
jgi:hypothetical protein